MPRKRDDFSNANLASAINAVVNEGLSKKSAAKKFKVSRSTLQHRLKNPDCKITCGPATVLSTEEEKVLEKWILQSCRKGFPLQKEYIQLSVKQFLDKNQRSSPFFNNYPGIGWYKAFMRRHPKLSTRTSEHVTAATACISEKDIRKWFDDIYQYLEEENLCDILNDPSRVFNGDETGFSLCPITKTVLAPKDVYEVAVGNAKENLTVMFIFSAAGVMCHPMVVFNYKKIPQDIVNTVPSNWGIGHSESGWMKSETFYEFVANIFHPFLLLNNIKLPVILFVDGHKSHLTYELSKLCTDLRIILIALYPNSTRILQPADVAAFRPLKDGWKRGVVEWQKKNSRNTAVTKKDFAPILEKVINETINPDILKNWFKACGLYPWNPNNINFNKCLGKDHALVEPVDFTNSLSNEILDLNTFCDIVGSEMVTKFSNIDHTSVKTTLSKESEALYKLYKLIKNNTEKKREDHNIEMYPNNELDNLPE